MHCPYRIVLFCLAAPCLLTGPARAADPQRYAVDLTGVPQPEIASLLRESSLLVSLAEAEPVPPFALVIRARDDIPRLATVMDSFGYYQNRIAVTVAGLAPEDPELPARLDAFAAGSPAPVVIAVTPGPLYHLNRITLDGALDGRYAAGLGIHSGEPAIAARVLDAGAQLQALLQDEGHALARVEAPQALADDAAHTLDVSYKVTPGPRVALGDIRFAGLARVNEAFVRRALILRPGETYRPARIEEARRNLTALGVFSGVSVRAAENLAPDGSLPLTFDVQERPRRAIAVTGSYSTDLGVTLSATWSHRNLFGNAEQLNLTAAGTGLGNASAGLGYDLKAQYVEPFFLAPQQVLDVSLAGVKQQLDTYDQTAQTLAVLLRREFSALWSGAAGLTFTHNLVSQQGTSWLYEMIGLPVSATYNSTGLENVLSDPLTGLRATASLTPTYAFGDSQVAFLVAQASAATYVDLFADGRSVLAFRALTGSILGASNLDLPPDQRLYAGGSATVRGYAYQSLGPQFADGTPIGAKAVSAVTAEWRQRVLADWGAAVFVDAGQAGSTPFDGTLYAGAGAGLRYYTPIGAIRADVAVPLVRLPGGAGFQVYIGLGQAF